MKTITTLALALTLSLPLAARADDAADRTAVSRQIVERTVLKTLDVGFTGALEKTVASMPDDKAASVRKDATAEFATQRAALLDGLSKQYAEKFSLDELKRLAAIYDDKTYQRFQAMNADPKSDINILSQEIVTRLLNMLTLAAANNQQGGAPGGMPGVMQMPTK